MQLKPIVAGVCLGMVALGARADYLGEVGANVLTSSTKYSADYSADLTDDGNLNQVYGQVFLGTVRTAGVPIREAAFLSRQSMLQLSQINATDKLKINGYSVGDTIKTSQSLLTTRFVVSDADVILGFAVGKEQQKDVYDTDIRGIQIGKYLDADAAVTLSYEANKVQPKQSIGNDAVTEKTITLAYHQVNESDQDQQSALDLLVSDYDDGNGFKKTVFNGGLTFYPYREFGMGAHLLFGTGSDNSYDYTSGALSADVSYEFTDSFGVLAKVQSLEEKRRSVQGNQKSNATSFQVGAALRF